MSTKQTGDAHNFGYRDAIMRYELYDRLPWFQWIGDIQAPERTNVGSLNHSDQIKMPTAVVHRLDGAKFRDEGTDYVQMPMIVKLEQPEKYGSHYLVGTGENLRYKFRKAFINQMSGVVTLQKTVLDRLRTDKWEQVYDLAQPQITSWFSERMNANFTSAIYEGHSRNITEGLNNAPDGIGAKIVYHPNLWYFSSATAITAVGTEGKCKTAAELNSVVTGGNVKSINRDLLYGMAETLIANNIQKGFMLEGSPYWLAVVNQKTWHKIISVSDVRADVQHATSGAMYNNPLFTPKMYRWGDFVFLLDEKIPRGWNTDATTEGFAGANGYHELPTNKAGAGYANTSIVILGEGALGYANVVEPKTEIEEMNFKQQKELALMSVFGISRSDWVDKTLEETVNNVGNADRAVVGANIVKNQSSAIFLVN